MAERKTFHYFSDLSMTVPHASGRYELRLVEHQGGFSVEINDKLNQKGYTPLVEPIEIKIFGKSMTVTPEWLVMFTWSPLYKSELYAHRMQAMFKSKELPLNYHPSNLYWKAPKGGIEDPHKRGYFIIPSHSYVSINRHGKPWTRQYNREIMVRKSYPGKENTYVNFNLRNNIWYCDIIGQHRAMAMAFLELDGCPFEMTVNHINGIKADNRLGNLEWSTYRDNNIHAKDEGLNKARMEVIMLDYVNHSVRRFKSLADCSFWLGVQSGSLFTTIKKNGIVGSRYEVHYRSDLESGYVKWKYATLAENSLNFSDREFTTLDCVRVGYYDVIDDCVFIYKDQYGIADALGLEPRFVLRKLTEVKKKLINSRYLIGYVKYLGIMSKTKGKEVNVSRALTAKVTYQGKGPKLFKYKNLIGLRKMLRFKEDRELFEQVLITTGMFSENGILVELVR